jgi:hypothetical protein
MFCGAGTGSAAWLENWRVAVFFWAAYHIAWITSRQRLRPYPQITQHFTVEIAPIPEK